MKKQLIFSLGLIAIALLSRLIPHWPNFTAMIAVAFSGGVLFGKRIQALVLPLLVLFLGDLIINNTLYFDGSFSLFTHGFAYIYGAYILVALLGVMGRSGSYLTKGLGALSAALIFYLVTNFGVWLGNPFYAQNLSGLMSSYAAGLPFLLNSAISTLFYGGLIVFAKQLYATEKVESVA